MSTITEYVIQRRVHRSFGNHESRWTGFSWESSIAKSNRPLMDRFNRNRTDLSLGEKIVRLVANANPNDEFRLILRTTVVEEVIEVTYAPRKPLTLLDLYNIASNPDHDGIHIFNGLVPVIKEAGLDPCNFGAISSKLVLFALDNINAPIDEWFLVLSDCYPTLESIPDYIHDREWWNLHKQAKIKYGSGINSYGFTYIDYKNGESYGPYKTFATAVKHTANGKGHSKTKARMPKTKII